MALTLEELAVLFTVQGDNNVVQAFINIENASNDARAVVAENMNSMGSAFGGLQSRMNQLAVSGAFAMESLAEGGERGLLRFARAIGMLGLAIDPLIGGLILLGAVLGETLVEKFQKAQKAAEDASKAFVKAIGDMANAGNVVGLQQKMLDLMKGTPIGEDGVRAAQINSAAWAGYWTNGYAYVSARVAELSKQMNAFTAAGQAVPQSVRDEFNKMYAAEETLRHRIEQTRREMTAAGVEQGNQIAVADAAAKKAAEDAKRAEEQRQRAEQRAHEIAIRSAELAGDYALELKLTIDWVNQMEAEYGKDSDNFKNALDAKVNFAKKGAGELKAWQDEQMKAILGGLKPLEKAGPVVTPSFGEKWAAELAAVLNSPEAMKALKEASKAAAKLPADIFWTDFLDELKAAQDRVDEQFRQLLTNVAETFASALAEGFTAAFSGKGIGGGLAAFGQTILKGLGEIFKQMGEALFVFGLTMLKLLPFLTNIFTSGPAAIAAGIALIALGSALSSAATGGGGGGVGGGSSPTGYVYGATSTVGTIAVGGGGAAPAPKGTATTGGIVPLHPVTANITVIGKDDPQAQRQILQLIQRAQLRGRGAL